MHAPILLTDVWKSYGKTQAVRGLNLEVPAQSIFGFLGPNGAGKSTTIRLILGLQCPDRGSVALFGHAREKLPTAALARIGSLVESPSLYPHLTGRENLEVHRRLLEAPAASIDRVLNVVGLNGKEDRLVQAYSSGMKQRLGLAEALLSDPELLLRDEPTNGLDPAGIQEVRSLIRELSLQHGVTVFLSSHLLAEVDQIATHLAIVSLGQSKFQGALEELRSASEPVLEIDVDQPERAFYLLMQTGLPAGIEECRLTVHSNSGYSATQINALLVRAGIGVSHLSTRHSTLEEVFLNPTRTTPERTEDCATPCL